MPCSCRRAGWARALDAQRRSACSATSRRSRPDMPAAPAARPATSASGRWRAYWRRIWPRHASLGRPNEMAASKRDSSAGSRSCARAGRGLPSQQTLRAGLAGHARADALGRVMFAWHGRRGCADGAPPRRPTGHGSACRTALHNGRTLVLTPRHKPECKAGTAPRHRGGSAPAWPRSGGTEVAG